MVRADFVVLFGALLVALFGVALTAGLAVALTAGLAVALTVDLAAGFAALTVAFTAGLALVLTAALAIRLDVAFTGVFATVVSSTPARMALRRTEVTPFIAAAFEPYGCEIATVEPFAACRVNRNLPALSLLMVNFAGTNASRCGAGALCGRRWAPIEHWSARRDHASAVLRETLSLSSELLCELLLSWAGASAAAAPWKLVATLPDLPFSTPVRAILVVSGSVPADPSADVPRRSHVAYAFRWRTSQSVAARSRSDTRVSQPNSMTWKGQYRLSG